MILPEAAGILKALELAEAGKALRKAMLKLHSPELTDGELERLFWREVLAEKTRKTLPYQGSHA